MEEKKVVLITGGTRGIGKSIAEKFAKEGYNLVLNYVSDNTQVKELEDYFKNFGAEVLIVKADVSKFEECENMVKQAMDKFSRIDVLINNAGITKDGLIAIMKEESFDKVIDVNLKGTFNVTRNVVPFMIKKKSGNIINVSSVVGIVGNAGR